MKSTEYSTRFHNLTAIKEWSTSDADEIYQISRWGEGYFGISDRGDLTINPTRKEGGPVINMMEVVEEMKNKGIAFPAVLRFHDILRSQVAVLNKTFRSVIEEARFNGSYHGVYPIKVNQMREVVEEIVDAGSPFNYGLEAGSKPELLAALAMNTNQNSLTVVNGYKDRDLLRLALLGIQLGRKVIVVIEKYSELMDLMTLSQELGVEPMIGLRAKIATKSSGKWASSGGDYAKFGLTITEILQAVNYMKQKEKAHCLKLLHFHIGSQIPDIRTIKDSITEGARIYAKLWKEGARLEFFDVGGGVGVNYDGTRSNSPSSVNYTTRDYVNDVVYILKQICDLEDVPHPNIVSESGRAITAHHSCVITNVFGALEIGATSNFDTGKAVNENILVTNMRDLMSEVTQKTYQETYNDAIQLKEESISAFKLGILTLDERAKLETIYWKICTKVTEFAAKDEYAPDEILALKSQMAHQYMCNFSVFQSAPDTWAIGQILPVLPIHKLNERPSELCTLVDITCDSDGKLDTFLSPDGPTNTVPMHKLNGDDYYIGLFMTGAYQDIMGDNHNCFGRLNEVHIFADDDDPTDFYIEEVIDGNKAGTVLSTLQYNTDNLAHTVKTMIDTQVKRGKIRPREGVNLTDFYENCLRSYTYLKK